MPTIVAVQLLHGVCYAFFFATVYIFVDATFPKDVRSSAQGLFNLLILGIGNVAASFLFPSLIAKWTDAAGNVDYRSLFMVPTAMALVAVLILVAFFRPPQRGPVADDAGHGVALSGGSEGHASARRWRGPAGGCFGGWVRWPRSRR